VIYLAHLEGESGQSYQNVHRNAVVENGHPSWAMLTGLSAGSPRARRVRVTRSLQELARVGLVTVGHNRVRERFEAFGLNREDGTQKPYKVPGKDAPKLVHLPASFFLNGWHLVLEPPEIAVLLAIIELTSRPNQPSPQDDNKSVALPERVRWGTFGLSGEVYEAEHELAEFGLIEFYDPMPERRRGKFTPPTREQVQEAELNQESLAPVPYRFIYESNAPVFDRNAFDIVTSALKINPLPPRLS
jgi:hypothetical protein